jgi:dihydrolipoamide dehydrogenase
MTLNFDLVIIGSGPGGYKAAITAAHLGARVAVVEKGLAGGTCLNQGCIPKRTLLHLASLIEDVQDLQGRGLSGSVVGDFEAALRHKDEVVAGIRGNFGVWLKRLGVQLIRGEARLLPGHRVRVAAVEGGEPFELLAPRIIVATGSRPAEVPQCPTNGRTIMNSRDFMFELKYRPETILFVGGGMIGAEFGFLLRQFDSRVTLVEPEERLLPRVHLPKRATETLERKLSRLGVSVLTRTTVTSAHESDGRVSVSLSDGSNREFDLVLVGAGREPFTDGLGLEEAGVAVREDGFIETSAYLETSVPGIYAIGDVKPGPMTANAALHDARIAAANALQGNDLTCNYFKVPVAIHSALEIAAVGLTEEQAEAAGFEAEVARLNFGASGKARAYHDTEGFIEVVHDAETGQLLGGCIVGAEAGEQIHVLSAACQSERGMWFFKDLSYSHPSWCEELETTIDPYTYAFYKSGKPVFERGILAGNQRARRKAG